MQDVERSLSSVALTNEATTAFTSTKAFRVGFVSTVGVLLLVEEIHIAIVSFSVVFISIIL